MKNWKTMPVKPFIINDPEEMEMAMKASWVAKIFQEHKLSVHDKCAVIKMLSIKLKVRETISV